MSDVSKYTVVDPRIVQNAPTYAVEKGALSLTNVAQRAIASSQSQQSYNIIVPSENVFVDRAVDWQCGVQLTVTVGGTGATGAGIFSEGVDWAPAPFPLHQCVSTMSATINDTTTTINTSDVLPQMLRLSSMSAARKQRTCPTMLDRYQTYPSGSVQASNLASFDSMTAEGELPLGSWAGVKFCTDSTFATVATGTTGGVTWVNGQPTRANNTTSSFTFYLQLDSVEKLVLSPFVFSDQFELSTGLFGVQNIQVLMNIQAPSRVLRVSSAFLARSPSFSVAYANANPWASPTLQVQFLTPALDVPLPPKSVVPYMEFPRYTTSNLANLTAGSSTQYSTQTVTLPNIPDYLMVFAKPATYADASNCDWVFPVTKVSVNFDNFSGLLSSHTQPELYKMSYNNGVDMSWQEWTGLGNSNAAGGNVGLVGGPLILRPGRDIPLQTGQAPGLVGNFSIQMEVTLFNQTSSTQTPVIYIVPISSGFFETIKGSSRIIKGVVTEQDILSAPSVAPVVSDSSLKRLVGQGMQGGRMGMAGGRMAGGAASRYM